MTFGLSAAAIGGIATAVGGIGSAIISGNAAQTAAGDQTQAANNAINVQQNEFSQIQKLLSPYINNGTSAQTSQNNVLTQEGNIAGANGAGPQQQAISAIQNGPLFQGLQNQGVNTILQNAAATGGVRGGNVQAALNQFSPQLLNQLIMQQYGQLGGLANQYGGVGATGESAAAQTGVLGGNNANSISSLLNNIGSAQAGGALSGANAINSGINTSLSGLGQIFGGSNSPAISQPSLAGLSSLFSTSPGQGFGAF